MTIHDLVKEKESVNKALEFVDGLELSAIGIPTLVCALLDRKFGDKAPQMAVMCAEALREAEDMFAESTMLS